MWWPVQTVSSVVVAPPNRGVVARGTDYLPLNRRVKFQVFIEHTRLATLSGADAGHAAMGDDDDVVVDDPRLWNARLPTVGIVSSRVSDDAFAESALSWGVRQECALMLVAGRTRRRRWCWGAPEAAATLANATVQVEVDTMQRELHVKFWLDGEPVHDSRVVVPLEGAGGRRWWPVVSLGAGQSAAFVQ